MALGQRNILLLLQEVYNAITLGGNLCDVQRLAGHASLQTMQRYAEENQAVEWKFIKLL